MATETLNIASIDQAANWTGVVGDIDEALASADGNEISNAANEGDVLILGFTNPSAITDADTVNSVTINIRGRRGSNAGDSFTVQLRIDNTAQGSAHDFADGGGTLGTSHSNSGAISDAGWNSDWTVAQLNGLQVVVVTTQSGMPEAVDLHIDCCDVVVDYTPAAVATYDQDTFRGRDDDQTLNSATFDYAANTNWTQDTDKRFRCRFLIQETAGEGESRAFKVQYNLASGGWNDVTRSSPIQFAQTPQYADLDATTQVLGAGTFVAGDGLDDNATSGTVVFSGNDETEIETCLLIDRHQVTDAQTFQLRVVKSDGTALTSYTNTPTITINEPTAGISFVTSETSNSQTVDPSFTPTGVQEGDLLLAIFVLNTGAISDNNGGTPFTQDYTTTNPGLGVNNTEIWSRTAGASEPATYNFTHDADWHNAVLYVFRPGGSGVLQYDLSPADARRNTDGGTASEPAVAVSITPSEADTYGVAVFQNDSTSQDFSAPDNGYGNQAGDTGVFQGLAVVSRPLPNAVATGTVEMEQGSAQEWLTIHFNIREGLESVQDTLDIQHNILNNVEDTLDIQHDVLQNVEDTSDLRWDILNNVEDTLDVRWNLLVNVEDTLDIQYDVLAFISDTLDIQYDVLAFISDTLDVRWNLLVNVEDTLDLQWDLLQFISDTLDVRWDMEGTVEDTLDIRWDMEGSVQDTLDIRHDILNNVEDTLDIRHDLLQNVEDPITFQWDLLQFVQDTVDFRWDLLQFVSDPLDVRYNVLNNVEDTVELQYSILQNVEDLLDIQYDVLNNVEDTLDARWNVLQTVLDTINTQWDVSASTTITVIDVFMTGSWADPSIAGSWENPTPAGNWEDPSISGEW